MYTIKAHMALEGRKFREKTALGRKMVKEGLYMTESEKEELINEKLQQEYYESVK